MNIHQLSLILPGCTSCIFLISFHDIQSIICETILSHKNNTLFQLLLLCCFNYYFMEAWSLKMNSSSYWVMYNTYQLVNLHYLVRFLTRSLFRRISRPIGTMQQLATVRVRLHLGVGGLWLVFWHNFTLYLLVTFYSIKLLL